MADEFKRLAGIDVFDETTGQLRDTYDILEDMAEVFPTLNANTQQYLGELAAGKRQINVLQSILKNWNSVEQAVENSADATGSAMRENEVYQNSIEGLSAQLETQLQNLSANLIDDDHIKKIYELGIAFTEGLNSPLAQSTVELLEWATMGAIIGKTASVIIPILGSLGVANNALSLSMKESAATLMARSLGLTADATALAVSSASTMTLAGATKVLTMALLSNPLFIGATALVGLLAIKNHLDEITITLEEQAGIVKDLTNEYDSLMGSGSEYDTLKKKTEELTQAEKNRLTILEATVKEKERQLALEKEELAKKWSDENLNAGLAPTKGSTVYNEDAGKYVTELGNDVLNINKDVTDLISLYNQGAISIGEYSAGLDEMISGLAGTYETLSAVSEESLGDDERMFVAAYKALLQRRQGLDGVAKSTDVVAGENIAMAESLEDVSDALDDLQSAYEVAQTAQDEYAKTGKISLDTYQDILKMSPQMISSLITEEGQISLNKTEWQNALVAQKQYLAESALTDLFSKAKATGSVADQVAFLKKETQGLATAQADLNNEYMIGLRAEISADTSKSWAERAKLLQDLSSTEEYARGLRSLPTITDGYAPLDPTTTSSSTTDLWKAQFEAWYKNQQHLLETNEITQEEYINALETKYKEYFSNLTKYQEEYNKYEEEVYKGRKDLFDDYLNDQSVKIDFLSQKDGTEKDQISVYKTMREKVHQQADMYRAMGLDAEHEYLQELGKLWWEYTKEIESLEQEMYEAQLDRLQKVQDAQEKQVNNYNIAINSAVDVLDKEIERLEEKKKALQDANEETEDAIELEKLQQNLENAKKQKTIRAYDEQLGFYWTADAQAVEDAEKELADYENQAKIDAIDKEIEKLQEQADAWQSLGDDFVSEQDKLIAEQILGADYEKEILAGRLDAMKDFASDYIAQLQALADAQERYNKLEAQGGYSPSSGSGGSSSSGSTSGKTEGLDPSWKPKIMSVNSYEEGVELLNQRQAELDKYNASHGGTPLKYDDTEKILQVLKDGFNVKGSFSSGGVADFTGLAQLHGTKSKPEYIFNHDQFSNMISSFKNLNPFANRNSEPVGGDNYTFSNVTIQANKPEELFSGLKQYAITHGRK